MGNTPSTTSSSSPPPPSAEEPRSKDKEVSREAGHVDSPTTSLPSSPPTGPPLPTSSSRPVTLHLSSPTPAAVPPQHNNNLTAPSFGLLAPTINFSVNVSPPPPSTGADSSLFSGRATTSSPSPPPSPRSQISAGSSVTSAGGRAGSFFWNMQEQYYNRKLARRQSQLESAGRLGRPCCLTLQSITLQGTFPSSAQVQAEISVLISEKSPQPELNHISELPPIRTPPRPPLRPGQVNIGGIRDVVLLPSVTASSILSITVLLDDVPIDTVRYPLSEITATLRPTELHLTPAGTGKTPPRPRSPSSSSFSSPSLFSSPLRRRHLSSSPPMSRNLDDARSGGANSSSSSSSRPPSPPPPSSYPFMSSPQPGGEGEGVGGIATLHAVWGEVVFYDNRSSGVGWVDLVEEGGKPVNEQRLLLATPQSFALMKTPHCVLGQEGHSMAQVRLVEPAGLSSLLPEKADDPSSSRSSSSSSSSNIASGSCRSPVTTTTTTTSTTTASASSSTTTSSSSNRAAPERRALVTISVSCPEKGETHILLAVDSEDDARRWTQLLKRAAHEAAFGGVGGLEKS